MAGKFNGKTLTISAKPTAGAKLPDIASATNVAGITIVGETMYCIKTSGTVTTLLKTTDYTNASAKATAVKKNLPYFALGLTKIGETLYMLAEKAATYGETPMIVKMDISGNVEETYDIKSVFPTGALGIAHTGNDNEFFVLARGNNDSDNATLTIKKLTLVKATDSDNNSCTVSQVFTVSNTGYGYTERIQDIYFHLNYGLFLLTNDTLSTGNNRILRVNYKNSTNSYIPQCIIEVLMKGYKQYNLESICMKANHLVLASNVKTSDGEVDDMFSVLNGITYEGGMYHFNTGLTEGALIPTKVDPDYSTTNLGCMSFKNGTPYFVKQSNNAVAVLGYSPSYTSTSSSYKKVITFADGTLGHANGMTCYDQRFYIATAKDNKVVALNYSSGEKEMIYTVKSDHSSMDIKALNYYNGKCILMSSANSGKTMDLFTCTFGTSSSVTATYIGTISNPLASKGLDVTQDIFYDATYGLFVGVCNADIVNNEATGITTENTLLHYNLTALTKTAT